MPELFGKLTAVFSRLESHYRDMQDVEFTIENGKLWILQTRSGKRTAEAALRIAVDLAEAGVLTKEAAVLRVDPGGARSASASDARSRCQEGRDRDGPAGLARRGGGRDRVHRR